MIKMAMVCSVLFLLMYITYHITSDSTEYGSDGFDKYVYYFILISHIILSVAVIPIVLFTYMRASLEQFEKHKKLARICISNLVICGDNRRNRVHHDFSILFLIHTFVL